MATLIVTCWWCRSKRISSWKGVEELPLLFGGQVENVDADLRQLIEEVASVLIWAPDCVGEGLELGSDRLSPFGVVGELALKLGSPLRVDAGIAGAGHLLEGQKKIPVGRVEFVELSGIAGRGGFDVGADGLIDRAVEVRHAEARRRVR
jgi:hypothetical protein